MPKVCLQLLITNYVLATQALALCDHIEHTLLSVFTNIMYMYSQRHNINLKNCIAMFHNRNILTKPIHFDCPFHSP